jgi:hypothetical protein
MTVYRLFRSFTAIAVLVFVALTLSPAHAQSTSANLTWSLAYYDFGNVPPSSSVAHTFTLTNTGGKSSGTVTAVSISLWPIFLIYADGCTGKALGAAKSCDVSVIYDNEQAPGGYTATLAATAEKSSASLSIFGNGFPNLVMTPGTYSYTDSAGSKVYSYDLGLSTSTVTTSFTLSNVGNATTNKLQLIGATNDKCSATTLAPFSSCTFDVQFSGLCSSGLQSPIGILGVFGFGSVIQPIGYPNQYPYLYVQASFTCPQ